MLRITTVTASDGLVLKLEGRLAVDWLESLAASWRAATAAALPVVIDLTDVTHVDQAGVALLGRLSREGARFRATDFVMRELVRELEEG